ncbi:MAG: hypothetical protein IPF92_03610 [Myxococcales bacterium]|nr:hypothetical protein [Myxococcales bacterium]HQY65265.1 hypothetical protein [Polyangiaceae bacterium]
MSESDDIGLENADSEELAATEESPALAASLAAAPPPPSRPAAPAAAPPAAPERSEPIQLAQGQSAGQSQAAYAAGPKPIPASRNGRGSDPAPAVIVDGAEAVVEPIPRPPSSGGLYIRPPGAPPLRPPGATPPPPSVRPPHVAPPAYAAASFVAPLPPPRRKIRSETVVIRAPRRGPSSKEKAIAFVVVLTVVALLGIIFVLLISRARPAAAPEVPAVAEPLAPTAAALPMPVAPAVTVAPPPVAVVGTPTVPDAGTKKKKPKH